jgi:hypothetical protein
MSWGELQAKIQVCQTHMCFLASVIILRAFSVTSRKEQRKDTDTSFER